MFPRSRPTVSNWLLLFFFVLIFEKLSLRSSRLGCQLAMNRRMSSVFVVRLVSLAIHYQIEYIIRILFPLRREERYNVSYAAFHRLKIRRTLWTIFGKCTWLPVLLHILLHIWLFRCVFALSEVSVLAKKFTRYGNFVTRGWSVLQLLGLKVFVSIEEYAWVDVCLDVALAVDAWPFLLLVVVVVDLFLFSGDIFVSSGCHKFLQVKFVGSGHFRSFVQISLIWGKVRVLADYTLVFLTFCILVRIHVLKLGWLHLFLLLGLILPTSGLYLLELTHNTKK